MKILVTGAGGPAGVCVIKSLRKKHDVVAVDSDKLASGLYLVKKSYIVPPADSEDFVKRIFDIAERENISVVIPTVSEEMVYLAKEIDLFSDSGRIVMTSEPAAIRIASNKILTYKFFEKEKYCPKVFYGRKVEFPCAVKPAMSRGSRGFYVCNSQKELEVAVEKNLKEFRNCVVMEYIDGVEYSVYGLSDLNGKPVVTVANKRIHASGESKKAQISNDKEVLKVAKDVASKLNLIGPWNVQIIKSSRGPKLVEVNPRFAGTVSLVNAAGIDYVGLAIKIFDGEKILQKELRHHNGLIMTRYNEEIFIEPEKIAKEVV